MTEGHGNSEFYTAFGEFITVVIGFVIFYIVMKKFAWGPIIGLLDERAKKIQDGFAEIKQIKADTEESGRQYEERLKNIEAEARLKIQEAVAEGQRVATEITDKARSEANAIVESSRKKMDLELATARKELRDEVIRLTFAATERIIGEKLTEDKDRQLVGAFISEMESKS